MTQKVSVILKWIIRIALNVIAIPLAIYTAVDLFIVYSYNTIDGGASLEGDFGFKLGMMVFGTWLILTLFYVLFCFLYWLIKRKKIRMVLWFLFLLGPALGLMILSRYNFAITSGFLLFNSAFYIGHALLNFVLNRKPIMRKMPPINHEINVGTSAN